MTPEKVESAGQRQQLSLKVNDTGHVVVRAVDERDKESISNYVTVVEGPKTADERNHSSFPYLPIVAGVLAVILFVGGSLAIFITMRRNVLRSTQRASRDVQMRDIDSPRPRYDSFSTLPDREQDDAEPHLNGIARKPAAMLTPNPAEE